MSEKLLDKTDEARAQQAFMAYFLENYPPDCILANPAWHAPKIFRAALYAIQDALPKYVSSEPSELEVQAGAVILATTPLIDAPKLSHKEWMGLSRTILKAARDISSSKP